MAGLTGSVGFADFTPVTILAMDAEVSYNRTSWREVHIEIRRGTGDTLFSVPTITVAARLVAFVAFV